MLTICGKCKHYASGSSKNDAAKEVAKTTGLKKGDIYRELF